VIKPKNSRKKLYACLQFSVICMTHIIGILIGFTYC